MHNTPTCVLCCFCYKAYPFVSFRRAFPFAAASIPPNGDAPTIVSASIIPVTAAIIVSEATLLPLFVGELYLLIGRSRLYIAQWRELLSFLFIIGNKEMFYLPDCLR